MILIYVTVIYFFWNLAIGVQQALINTNYVSKLLIDDKSFTYFPPRELAKVCVAIS